MKKIKLLLFFTLSIGFVLQAQIPAPFPEKEEKPDKKEVSIIGYYFMRGEQSNTAPTNEFLKGQVVGRLFGGNTVQTSNARSSFFEQRFIPMIAYSPRLFDNWATVRMNLEFDWTLGDANYGAGGNLGGAFAADFVNVQTQNLFVEFRPKKTFFVNAGMTRLFDNVAVPAYTGTSQLLQTGYRLAFWGSDASGIAMHNLWPNQRMKVGAYQLYENNINEDDDVTLYEVDFERDLDITNSIGISFWHLRDYANGEGGVSILGQGLNCTLSNYNGVFNFNFGDADYTASINWLGTHFHGNPLLNQGRFGYSGFGVMNFGQAKTATQKVDILGFAANLRLAYKYGRTPNDFFAIDGIFTTGDKKNINDDKYTGVLTGNNWTSPGAVFYGHGLYLLLPHGLVVNRFTAAVLDIQNVGYGFAGGSMIGSYDIVRNKLKGKVGFGTALAPVAPAQGGNFIGAEANFNLCYTLRVFMDLELHAAYLKLGDFFDSPEMYGSAKGRPQDPWTLFATLKWIMF
jgi:hypothetical protein